MLRRINMVAARDRVLAFAIAIAAALAVLRRHLARTRLAKDMDRESQRRDAERRDVEAVDAAAFVHVGFRSDFRRRGEALEYVVIAHGERWRAEDVLVVLRPSDLSVWAIANTCPHAGYPLDEGDIEDLGGSALDSPVVSCPAHAYLFDMQRGTCISMEGCPPAPVYRAELRGDRLFLSAQQVQGGATGTHMLCKSDENALQLEMVDRALTRKYGPG
jgi:nitrite reductase/ring-hydroxylating ferredoxin subunit